MDLVLIKGEVTASNSLWQCLYILIDHINIDIFFYYIDLYAFKYTDMFTHFICMVPFDLDTYIYFRYRLVQ